jgi:hypothetical protein
MKLEVFEDRMYFDQFAVRPEGSKSFNDTIHFVRKADALVAMRVIENWIAQEREACAKVCDDRITNEAGMQREDYENRQCAAAIRARGENK